MHERGRLLRQDPFDRPRRSFAAARSRESSLWVCDNDPYFVAITILSQYAEDEVPHDPAMGGRRAGQGVRYGL